MQVFTLDGEQARNSQEVLSFLSDWAFVAEAWPGWGASQAAAAHMARIGQGARWLAGAHLGLWQWLIGREPLDFDSRIFGRRLGRLLPLAHRQPWPQAPALDQGWELLERVLAEAWDEGLEGLVARVPARDFLAAQVLEAHGFALADLSVEWLLDLRELPAGRPLGLEAQTRLWRPADQDPLLDLAARAFCDLDAYADRFALDPRLRPGCPELYRAWLSNSFQGREADMVLVLEAAGRPGGFITLKKGGRGSGPQAGCGWVVLNALEPDLRGRGFYNLLLLAGLHWLKAQGARAARVRTKISQQAVIRAWSRLGARQVYADITFHLWRKQAKERT